MSELDDVEDQATIHKPGRGRPTAYREEYAGQAAKLCRLGATNADLADFFDVDVRTIDRWLSAHEEFCRAVKPANEEADDRVERSLYHRAVGYQQDAVKIMQYEGKPVVVPYRENVQPDTVAAIFWLKNRRSKDWKDRQHHDHEHTVTLSSEFEGFVKGLTADAAPKLIEATAEDVEPAAA